MHAAAGGVGLAAVQIAKAFGATVIATAGTKHKLDVARSFGADYGVDYRQDNWPEEVKKLTPKGRGVDIVYDPVGMVAQSMKCRSHLGLGLQDCLQVCLLIDCRHGLEWSTARYRLRCRRDREGRDEPDSPQECERRWSALGRVRDK